MQIAFGRVRRKTSPQCCVITICLVYGRYYIVYHIPPKMCKEIFAIYGDYKALLAPVLQ